MMSSDRLPARPISLYNSRHPTMTRQIAIATAALTCFAALPALAARGGNDVRIQGNHKKTQVSGEKGAYHLVEKGSRMTATVKGPADVTVLLHGTTASAAAGLFLDKKKIHFVDLKGASAGKLSTGGVAGPLKTEHLSIPDGTHEIGVEAFVGGAAVAFRVAHAGGGAGVVATGKHRHKSAAVLAAASMVPEPLPPPPAEVHELQATEVAPLTAPPPPAVVTVTPPPPPPAEDTGMMMGEPPPKPAQAEIVPAPANPPPEAIVPVPVAATSTTSVTMETGNPENRRSSATYWLAGAAVLVAAGAVTAGALSSSQNSSYLSASDGTANRASMLSTANTELIFAEALTGAAFVLLGCSAAVAW
jgi:hypothetical protein